MATFSEIMADKNKLEQLKSALANLQKLDRDAAYYPKISTLVEAGYPVVKDLRIEQTKKAITKLEQKIAANDQF
jgi:hypothetical protein